MVLTKSELVTALQKEVRILLHLAGKIDRTQLDYRPNPKQRSTIELLRYLTVMGPAFVQATKAGSFDRSAWTVAMEVADGRDVDQTLAAIAAQRETFAALLADVAMPISARRSRSSGIACRAAPSSSSWCWAGFAAALSCSCT